MGVATMGGRDNTVDDGEGGSLAINRRVEGEKENGALFLLPQT